MFGIGLAIRVAYITLGHSYRFHTSQDHFEFGWEMGRVGRSLALDRGFADPFVPPGTGPTAWMPPLYPLIIAAIFRAFGAYSLLSGWMLLVINSIFNAAAAPAVYEIAWRCFGSSDSEEHGRRVALWSAWIWVLYPATMQYAVRWIWEMSLTTMLFAWVVVFALRLRGIGEIERSNRNKLGLWAGFGLLWGLIALSNATPLLLLPVCGIWILIGVEDKRRGIAGAVLAAVVFCACLVPWICRNWQVFHALIPTRGNFGAELYVGNGPESNGFPWGITVYSRPDLESYARSGEVAFVKERGRLAKAWIASHPAQFAELSLKRAYFYWVNVPHPAEKHWFLEAVRETTFCLLSVTGWLGLALALWRGVPGSRLFAWAFLLLPVTYYFVTAGARFRHPLEPLLIILTVYLFASAQFDQALRR
jgi:hypothetical protein